MKGFSELIEIWGEIRNVTSSNILAGKVIDMNQNEMFSDIEERS